MEQEKQNNPSAIIGSVAFRLRRTNGDKTD